MYSSKIQFPVQWMVNQTQNKEKFRTLKYLLVPPIDLVYTYYTVVHVTLGRINISLRSWKGASVWKAYNGRGDWRNEQCGINFLAPVFMPLLKNLQWLLPILIFCETRKLDPREIKGFRVIEGILYSKWFLLYDSSSCHWACMNMNYHTTMHVAKLFMAY